jgi:hypothetical protein
VRKASIRIIFRYQGVQRRERLCVDGQPMLPTPANVKYAHRLAIDIGDKVRIGTFNYSDYFPDSEFIASETQTVVVPMLFDGWTHGLMFTTFGRLRADNIESG